MTKHLRLHNFAIPEGGASRLAGLNYTLDPDAIGIVPQRRPLPAAQIQAATALLEARHAIANEIERLMRLLDESEPDPDLELSVGGLWSQDGALDDAEDDPEENEPSLAGGAAEAEETQEAWAEGECDHWADCEFDPAESGIADVDGLDQQMAPV